MGLWRDVQHGVRLLARARGFTLLAVVTLALGIGATTAIISLVRAVFFNTLPFADSLRLVEMNQTFAHRPERLAFSISLPDYQYYRDHARSVVELVAHYPTAPLQLTTGTQSAEIAGSVDR